METISALLVLCEESTSILQSPVDSPPKGQQHEILMFFFFHASFNKLLNKQLSWWSEVPWCSSDVTVKDNDRSTIQQRAQCWFIYKKAWYTKECHMEICSMLTHWLLIDLGSILKMQFSILFYRLVFPDHLMIMPSGECHGTLLMISQLWFR